MGLTTCVDCGAKMGDTASMCLQCGGKPKQGMSLISKLILGLIGLGVLSSMIGEKSDPAPAVAAAPKEAVDPNINLRFQKTVLVATALKSSLRNPDSVQWSGMLANDDASVICIEYRAQNGFGGMNLEHVAFAKGKLQTSVPAWNKYCAEKKMWDMKTVKYAL